MMRSRPPWPPALAALLCCLLATVPGHGAHAVEVLVVLSSDKAPYLQAMEGLRAPLAAQGHRLVARQLAELDGPPAPGGAGCVIAVGTPAAVWLHGHPPAAAPALYCMVSDPEGSGLGTMRGVTTDIPVASQVALIGEALPAARAVGVLYHGDQERSRRQVDELRQLLPAGWRLVAVPVERHQGSADAIDALFEQGIDVVWTTPDSGVYTEAVIRTLLLTALRRRVPVFGFSLPFVRAGGLFGVGINPATQGVQAAALAQRLLAEPAARAEEPHAIPPQFEIGVNLVVAQKLSLELPKELVRRASQTFQPGR